MAIYTIADLHLSFSTDKPMNVFGDIWDNYEERLKENWIRKIKDDDLVVLPGDFSWAMKLEDTYKDFEFLNNLPGKKVLLKGNHDYWWGTVKKMNQFLEEKELNTISFLQNESFEYGDYIIAGTRGWVINDTENEKIINREMERLKLSLKDAESKNIDGKKEIIVFMHYPPVTQSALNSLELLRFVEIMRQYSVKRCYYGHLHSESIKTAYEGETRGISFKLVSADNLKFDPLKIVD